MSTLSFLKRFLINESVLTRAIVRTLAGPGPITMLMLVRDERDIIQENIRFHARHGVESFVITDNGSLDGTRDILADLQKELGSSMRIIDDAEPAYLQAELVNRMLQVAKQVFRPKWIISSDADEFWYPVNGSYQTELNRRNNILDCFWHNFLPNAGTNWKGFTAIGEMPGYHARMKKALCMSSGLFGFYTGNHEVRAMPQISAPSENIRVYHYPIRTYEQLERKVVQGHRAVLKASLGENASWHWREYYQAWEDGRLPDLYRQLSSQNQTSEDTTMCSYFSQSHFSPIGAMAEIGHANV